MDYIAWHRKHVRVQRISNLSRMLTLPWKCRWNGWVVIVVSYLIWGKPMYEFELIQNDSGLELVCWERTRDKHGSISVHRSKLLLFRIGRSTHEQ